MDKKTLDKNNLMYDGIYRNGPYYNLEDVKGYILSEYYPDVKTLYLIKTEKEKRFLFLRNVKHDPESYRVIIEEDVLMLLMKDLGYYIKPLINYGNVFR